MPEIEVRLARDDEYERINDLYNRAYGNIRPFKHFQWEFIDGPAGKAIYIIALDKDTGEIVATQSAIPLYMSGPDGAKILTAKSEDTYVNPDYRGLKIFDKLYDVLFKECTSAGINAIWGFTYALKPFRKVGFDIPFSQLQGVYVTDFAKASNYLSGLNAENKFKQKVMIAGLSFLSRLKTAFTSTSTGSYVVKEELVKDKATAYPKDKWQQGYYTLWQDKPYTEWRISDNPYHNEYHELTIARQDGTAVANVLVNVRGNNTGYIEQIIMKEGSTKEDKAAAIKAAISRLRKANVFLIRFWGFDYNAVLTDEAETLKSCGFIFIKKGTGFVWYDYNKDNSAKIDPFKIHISRIYTQGNG
jgi:GNAT superfamily N-acetyltransferase